MGLRVFSKGEGGREEAKDPKGNNDQDGWSCSGEELTGGWERHKAKKSDDELLDLFFLSNFCERRTSPLWAGRRRAFNIKHQTSNIKKDSTRTTVAGSL
jgi:hypothetical protein